MALAGGALYTYRTHSAAAGAFVTSAIAAAGLPVNYRLGTNPAGTYSDNGLVFGSQVVTINAITYVAEDIDLTAGSKRIETTNENGVPNKQAFMDEVPNGSLTLQLASAATLAPTRYQTLSLTPVGTGATAQTYIISEVGQKFEAAGETKVSVKVYLQLSVGGQAA